MSNSQATIRLCDESRYIQLILNDFEIKLLCNYCTKCIMLLICCSLKDSEGKQVFSTKQVSVALGYSPTWGYNKWNYMNVLELDFKLFFKTANKLEDNISCLVKSYVHNYPLLSPTILYEGFNDLHPTVGLSFHQFNQYVNALDTRPLLSLLRSQLQKGKLNLQLSCCLELLVTELSYSSTHGAKYIKDLASLSGIVPTEQGKSYTNGTDNSLYMLVALLYQSGISQGDLSKYFGISKGSVHNYIYRFALPIQGWLLSNIDKWSGKICIDEKWIKVAGKWQYVLTAVDAISGIPLLSKRFRSVDTCAWVAFLKEFRAIYGKPQLITSDGSGAIAKAIILVFKGKVRHQLCWFHKLKNLYKHIYANIKEQTLQQKATRLALNAFHNTYGSSRKKAAKTLANINCGPLNRYIHNSILKPWRQLTLCLTSNAAERYNRKIQKAICPRYGLKNEACADVLINLTWFKDILFNGQIHLQDQTDFNIQNFQQFAQQEAKIISIHFSKNFSSKTLNSRAS